MTTIKLKNGSGAPTAGDIVQGEPALDLTNKRLYTEDSGGTVIEVGTNPGTDVTFADNRKAIFGAGSDLQIYHDGTDSYVDDQGTGRLRLRGASQIILEHPTNGETYAAFQANGASTLYYDNAVKLATTSTGIDVTGVITTDGMTTSADINFGDNDKAVFGAGSDLQIYHDGSSSYVIDNGSGNLHIRGSSVLRIQTSDGSGGWQNSFAGLDTGSSLVYYNGSAKLSTTSTGIDVTGSVTADALTVDGLFSLNSNMQQTSAAPRIELFETDATDLNTRIWQTGGDLRIYTLSDDSTSSTERIRLDHATGDLSLYNSAGTSQDLYWDASTSRLGLGTTSPSSALDIDAGSSSEYFRGAGNSGSARYLVLSASTTTNAGDTHTFNASSSTGHLQFATAGVDRVTIDNSGNVGIGASTVNRKLEIAGNNNAGAKANYIRITDTDTTATLANQQGGIEFYASDTSAGAGVTASIEVLYAGSGGGGEITFNTAANSGAGVTERMRVLASGGITFNGDTSTANALDDYEEGAWTPVVEGATSAGSGTYSFQAGNYTKVGNLVMAAGRVTFSGHTGTGNMELHGLPFTSTNTGFIEPPCIIHGSDISLTANNTMVATVKRNDTYIEVLQALVGGGSRTVVPMDAAGTLHFTIIYQAA